MNIKDHRQLAQWLTDKEKRKAPVSRCERAAFILGNMEPDMNVFTYFRGFFTHTRMRGHNYENTLGKIEKLLLKVEKRRRAMKRPGRIGLGYYFMTGVLTHYIADAFTRPHNEAYEGGLRGHVVYEMQLHQMWKNGEGGERMREPQAESGETEAADFSSESALAYFIKQHEEYLTAYRCMQDDIIYILRVSDWFGARLLCGKGKKNERNDYLRCNYDSIGSLSVVYGTENEKGKTRPVFFNCGAGIDAVQGSERIGRISVFTYYRFFRRDFTFRHLRARE